MPATPTITTTGHYTAIVEVVRSDRTEARIDPGYNKPVNQEVSKSKRDIARIVVRADSMEKLQERLSAHVALIVDDEGMSSDAE